MTYPQVTTNEHRRRRTPPASRRNPRFPEIEERVLKYWDEDGTFVASVEGRDAGDRRRQRVRLLRRSALRQRPAALRPPAHRLRQGHRPALPDDARQARRAPLRLGHPRPARRARGAAPARAQDEAGHRRARHRHVQRRLPQLGAEVHGGVARLRHAPGALGRLRQRLQDARARLHGVGHLGLQAAAREGPRLRGLPRAALLLERPDARCPTTSCAWTTTSTRCARTPPSRSGCASRPASSPSSGRRRRGPCRPTSASWSHPDIDYVVVESDVTGTTERYVIGAARLAAYAKDLFGPDVDAAQDARSSSGSRAPTCSAASFTPPFSYYAGARARAPRLPGRVRHHRGRHRAGPHRRRVR